VADWRFLRGWTEQELEQGLQARRALDLNFDPLAPKPVEDGWQSSSSETRIAHERPGPPEPGGAFEKAWEAIMGYEFSDPGIVAGHFDPSEPLPGRIMLLELKALGFRFLAGTRVGAIRLETGDDRTVHGYRYDTLRGHVEAGWEWFLLTKSHPTGEVRFRIEAEWRPGDFANAWSRLGFRFLAERYQRRWTRRAHQRLRRIVDRGPTAATGLKADLLALD
jgi:uncharacterized protein (UPF0548 family)